MECRYPDSGCVVLATSFEEQYPARGIFGQSACQDASRRSCSNDEVVKHHAVRPASGQARRPDTAPALVTLLPSGRFDIFQSPESELLG
jgi:hypothetical protein